MAGDPADEIARIVALGVSDVTHDSRQVRPGTMFACLRGDSFDGHAFAADAVHAGASALLVDHRLDGIDEHVPQIVVPDTRRALGPIAAAVVGHPSRRLTTIGVTGTNGKTSTTHLLAAMLEAADVPTGVIGTLSGPRTTPEAPELQAALADLVATGIEAVAIEVSSHALELHRVDGTDFDVVAFTNFGHDHLDLHGSPEEYFRAKSMLFTPEFAKTAVINVDDPHGRLLADTIGSALRIVEVGRSDVSAVEVGTTRSEFRWRGHDVAVALGGDFSVDNALLALTIAAELGIDEAVAASALTVVDPIPGRFEVVLSPFARERGITVVVDYAHTPDGLRRVLGSARDAVSRPDANGRSPRVIVVFGCGGERDVEKRPEMGNVAALAADVIIVTSDNPRNEDPMKIIEDVLGGVPDEYRARVTSHRDRRQAIATALDVADSGDIVVIAGKGHEQTQDLGASVVEFDDRAVARELLEESS